MMTRNPLSLSSRQHNSPPILFGLLLLLLVGHGCGEHVDSDRPNIIVITLDTTRADRLGCYGYHQNTSPNLNRLAADGVVYDNAYSTSSWTLPSHASLFTAKLPTSHGARYDEEGPFRLTSAIGGKFDAYRARGLSSKETTLAEVLLDQGYRTGAVVAGPWLKRAFGLAKGFQDYDDSDIESLNGRRADSVTDSAIRFVEKNHEHPFFLFLNYFDAHSPYDPPADFARRFLPEPVTSENSTEPRIVNALYDAEIAFMDEQVGRLVTELRALSLYDRSLIIITADHGELLFELGGLTGHSMSVSEPEIHIPLIVKHPLEEGSFGREKERVQLIDIMPTILDRLGIDHPEGIQGQPLTRVTHPIVAEFYPLPQINQSGDWRALFHKNMKFVWNSQGQGYLVKVTDDPYETTDVSDLNPELVRTLTQALERYLASLPPPGTSGPGEELDEETLRALEELGYLK